MEKRLRFALQLGAMVPIATIWTFLAAKQCCDSLMQLLTLPLAVAMICAPMLVVYAFFRAQHALCTLLGVIAIYPFYYIAYWADFVQEPSGGGAAFGALIPFFFGAPVSILVAWITKVIVRHKTQGSSDAL